MAPISEAEFRKILDGIIEDREVIIRNNPIGSHEEVLLWMLLSSLVVYLSLNDMETPCFSGRPDARTYREAIEFVLRDRRSGEFDVGKLLDKLSDT